MPTLLFPPASLAVPACLLCWFCFIFPNSTGWGVPGLSPDCGTHPCHHIRAHGLKYHPLALPPRSKASVLISLPNSRVTHPVAHPHPCIIPNRHLKGHMSTNDHLIFQPKTHSSPVFPGSIHDNPIQPDIQARNLGVIPDAVFPYPYSCISKAWF